MYGELSCLLKFNSTFLCVPIYCQESAKSALYNSDSSRNTVIFLISLIALIYNIKTFPAFNAPYL